MKCPGLLSSVQWDHMLLYPACSQSQYTFFLAQLDEEYLINSSKHLAQVDTIVLCCHTGPPPNLQVNR